MQRIEESWNKKIVCTKIQENIFKNNFKKSRSIFKEIASSSYQKPSPLSLPNFEADVFFVVVVCLFVLKFPRK